jgi:hypothetical protein
LISDEPASSWGIIGLVENNKKETKERRADFMGTDFMGTNLGPSLAD